VSLNPYLPPQVVPASAPWCAVARRGATLVVACEAARSIAWRLNSAMAIVHRGWPDPTYSNRVIRVLGAAGMIWGACRLTDISVPLHARLRTVTRALTVVGLAAHGARLLLALAGTMETVSEPTTILVDALAMAACGASGAHLLRRDHQPGWARSAYACSVLYLLASSLRVLVLVSAGNVSVKNATALLSLVMVILGFWAWAIASRLGSTPSPDAADRHRDKSA
jgi:hypothetical protein